MSNQPTALDLEAALEAATTEDWAQVAADTTPEFRARLGTARRAAREASAASIGATGSSVGRFTHAPDWLKLGALDSFVRWQRGEAALCEHRPTTAAPEPVTAAAWRPGAIVCAECVGLLRVCVDHRCDGCGTPDDGTTLRLIVWHESYLAYRARACPPCWAEMSTPPTDDATRGPNARQRPAQGQEETHQ